MQTNLKKTIRKIYLYKALTDFILLYPLYNIMFADHGLSTFQISTLLVIWATTDLVTNVPMGVLADRFARRKLLAIAPLIEAVGFLVWLLHPTYLGFALGFVLWGVGGALFDGTYEALVYDELKAAGMEGEYVKVTGRASSFALIANGAATALAGAAILLGYGFVIGASIVALVGAAGIALTLPQAKRYEEVADRRYFAMLKEGVMQAARSRAVLGLVLLGGFIGAIYGSLEEYVPLFLTQARFSHSLVPPLVAVTVVAAALASFVAHRYEHLDTVTFMGLLFLSGLLLLGAGLLMGVGAFGLIVAYTFLINLLVTVFDGKVQHAITGGLRATVTSVSLFVVEVMSIVTYLVYGWLSRHGGNFMAFKVIGGFVAVIALAYLLIAPRLLSGRTIAEAV